MAELRVIVTAMLVRRDVPGWPDSVISPTVPIGKLYRVDLATKRPATLRNLEHPEWGVLRVQAVTDVDDGYPLPMCCLRIVSAN